MASITHAPISAGRIEGALARVRSLAAQAAENWNRWRLYRRTLAELSNLSDRELADLGLNRSMLIATAREAAYGAERA